MMTFLRIVDVPCVFFSMSSPWRSLSARLRAVVLDPGGACCLQLSLVGGLCSGFLGSFVLVYSPSLTLLPLCGHHGPCLLSQSNTLPLLVIIGGLQGVRRSFFLGCRG